MKKILFVLAIAALIFSVSSCGNKKKKAESATHTHEDGTVHAGTTHGEQATAKPDQEAFEVDAHTDTEHEHGDTDAHDHDHDHDHSEHN